MKARRFLFRKLSSNTPFSSNSAKTAYAKMVLPTDLRERYAEYAENSANAANAADSEVHFYVVGVVVSSDSDSHVRGSSLCLSKQRALKRTSYLLPARRKLAHFMAAVAAAASMPLAIRAAIDLASDVKVQWDQEGFVSAYSPMSII